MEKLAHLGLVHLKHAGRSVMVELNTGFEDGEAGTPKPIAAGEDATTDAAATGAAVIHAVHPAPHDHRPSHDQRPPVEATESAADGVRIVGQMLRNATGARWPMYLRNVKQILRTADASFDERRYGFVGLMDLLKACSREGFVRLERDRRGGLRVFPGAALQRVAAAPTPIFDIEHEQADPDAQPAHLAAAMPQPDVESKSGRCQSTRRRSCWDVRRRKPRSRLGARAPEPSRARNRWQARKPRKTAGPKRARAKKDAAADSGANSGRCRGRACSALAL